MATTIIGYFKKYDQALQVLEDLVASDYNPEFIKLAYEPDVKKASPVDFDNTIEQGPVIEFKDATFGAELNEEDAVYYSQCLDKGEVLLTVFVATDPTQERDWELETAKTLADFLSDGGAYDHEIRKVYSNRAGLTTYPQNRFSDPVGPNKMNRDRIYESRSPLNGEVSNVLGVSDNRDYVAELEEQSGRRILTAAEILASRK